MARWRRWWRFANVEQLFSFVLVTVVTIGFTSMLAHSTLSVSPTPEQRLVPADRGATLQRRSAAGSACCSLPLARFRCSDWRWASSITPAACGRHPEDDLSAEIVHDESRMYFWLVWGMVGLGCSILLAGHVAADHAARHLGVDRRDDDVPVLVPADRAEQAHAPRGDSHQLVPDRPADVVDAAVRIAGDLHHLR